MRNKSEKGSVMVESALTFLVFFLMLIGIFDFGQFLFVHQALVDRARAAARWGSINDPTDHTSIQNMVLYNQSATPAGGTATYMNLTAGNVSVSDVKDTPLGSGKPDYRLIVRVSGYSFTALSPYMSGSMTGPSITIVVPLGEFN
jgi:Flp pilus assembly protein TadG